MTAPTPYSFPARPEDDAAVFTWITDGLSVQALPTDVIVIQGLPGQVVWLDVDEAIGTAAALLEAVRIQQARGHRVDDSVDHTHNWQYGSGA